MAAPDIISKYDAIVDKLTEYHQKALWQEKLRLLQEVLDLCEEPNFPDAEVRKRDHLYDLGGIWRRVGQYDKAEETLRKALEISATTQPLQRATVLGELGVVLRHMNRFAEAESVMREQYDLARAAPPSLEADIVACRAIGNVGMCAYNMSQKTHPPDRALLERAIAQLRERVQRATDLQQRLRSEMPQSTILARVKDWQVIGMDRLALCYVAQGATDEAVRIATASQQIQDRVEPTITALSKCFYGHALWAHGQLEEALAQWNAPRGVCSSPIALCKEPSEEHAGYLQLLANAGADFDSHDEQGYSALEYAVLSDNPDAQRMIPIVVDAIRARLEEELVREGVSPMDIDRRLEEEVAGRLDQAELRRQYRTILQEHIRPLLRTKDTVSFPQLRDAYAQFLHANPTERQMFSPFRYVRYADFHAHGALPMSSAGLAKRSNSHRSHTEHDAGDFVIFISYRWLGGSTPDDTNNSQWCRIVDALDRFIGAHPDIDPERLGVWLDYACIDQVDAQEKMRGVNGLPLAVALCNAMISLTDHTYYERAWCAVETMLIGAVMQYRRHEWWEHRLDAPETDLATGTLQRHDTAHTFDPAGLKLTNEREDRPKIDFLIRQSRLLGKDDAMHLA